jgi:hypothetical protein
LLRVMGICTAQQHLLASTESESAVAAALQTLRACRMSRTAATSAVKVANSSANWLVQQYMRCVWQMLCCGACLQSQQLSQLMVCSRCAAAANQVC